MTSNQAPTHVFNAYGEKDLPVLAARLRRCIGTHGKLALQGTLGAGKTTLLKALGTEMGLHEQIDSPTFTIVQIYGHPPQVYHIDCYRLEQPEELFELGFEDFFYDTQAAVWLEWPERIAAYLTDHFHWLHIQVREDERRDYQLFSPANLAQR